MSTSEKIIGQGTSFEFREPPGRVESPVTLEEFNTIVEKIVSVRRMNFINARGHAPNTLILSNRQFYALRKFGRGTFALHPTREGHNEFLALRIIVDARGDHPNTPLVGYIEF